MTERWTLRWTGRIFAEYRIKKHSTFAVSKDKSLFEVVLHKRWRLNKAQTSLDLSSAYAFIDLLIQKILLGRPRD